MTILIALMLAMIPAVAILYPFLRRRHTPSPVEDETSTRSELDRRWEAALAGLRTAELDRAVGTLAEDDYRWLRERYMTDAALVMKAMELEEQEEREMLAAVEREVRQVRERVLGENGAREAGQPTTDG